MNINLLSFSNNKKSSHICVEYDSEDVYTAGKSANCDLTPNWAQFISVAGQRLYTIQRCRPISAILAADVLPSGGNVRIKRPPNPTKQTSVISIKIHFLFCNYYRAMQWMKFE